MTYKQFVAESKKQQRAYIASEFKRYKKARKLWTKYQIDMYDLGLHPLDSREIEDRRLELEDMVRRVDETHGDSEGMRAIYAIHHGSNPSNPG